MLAVLVARRLLLRLVKLVLFLVARCRPLLLWLPSEFSTSELTDDRALGHENPPDKHQKQVPAKLKDHLTWPGAAFGVGEAGSW